MKMSARLLSSCGLDAVEKTVCEWQCISVHVPEAYGYI